MSCRVLFAILLGLCGGCTSADHSRGVWLSRSDLKLCESTAVARFARDFSTHQLDLERSAIIQVADWRIPTVTVYLPIQDRIPASRTFAYYKFRGSVPFDGKADVFSFAGRTGQKLEVVENGVVSWGTGSLIRKPGWP